MYPTQKRSGKYEFLIYLNLGFSAVLLPMVMGACQPQVRPLSNGSFAIVQTQKSSSEPVVTEPVQTVSLSNGANVKIVDSLGYENALRFAQSPTSDSDPGLGLDRAQAEGFAQRFGVEKGGARKLEIFRNAFRFAISKRDVQRSQAFAERFAFNDELAQNLSRYFDVYERAVAARLPELRQDEIATLVAERFFADENAFARADQWLEQFAEAQRQQLSIDQSIEKAHQALTASHLPEIVQSASETSEAQPQQENVSEALPLPSATPPADVAANAPPAQAVMSF